MTSNAGKPEGLADSVRAGFAFSGGTQVIRQAAELATSILLARLLLPADFGVTAVIGSFLQLSYVVGNLGMSGAVVQTSNLSDEDCHAAFTLSTGIGFALTVCATLVAGWAAGFFAMPILRVVMPIMSLQMLLAGASATPVALLRRELRFGYLAVTDAVSTLLYALVGVGLAASGYGIWSLVWAPLVSATWVLVSAHVFAAYRPRLCFHAGPIRKLVGFGGTLTVKNIFVHLGRNSDNLVVARVLGDTATGLYTRAFNFTTMPQTRLVGLLYSICFPAFCRLRSDRERFHEWYLKATAAVAVVVAPILLGLFVVAEDFTVTLVGPRWIGMVPSFRILCIAGLFNSLHMLGGAAIEASGKLRYEVATESGYALLIVLGSVLGARFGIEGVSGGVLFAAAAMYAAKAFTLRAAIGLPIRRYLQAVMPSTVAAVVMGGTVFGALAMVGASPTSLTRLVIGSGVGAITYVAALSLIGPAHLKVVADQLRRLVLRERERRLRPRVATT